MKKKYHGINLPLFSLHSQASCGVGEILDLLPMIDWIHDLGFDVLQLLPLNDTGTDASPYNCLSSCAIHPIYLSLSKLPHLENYPDLTESLELLRSLNHLPKVSYSSVRTEKKVWMDHYLARVMPLIDLGDFEKKHPWVTSYAQFVDPQEPKRAVYTQFFLYQQLKQVKQHADKKNVLLIGDLPFLTCRESVDVLQYPQCFDLNFAVGAPPDMFSSEGQNWGFPLFLWDEVEKSGYEIWKNRLTYAQEFYHLFRLDHIIGFFRLWGIPIGQSAKFGRFYPDDFKKCLHLGKKHLEKILSFTHMTPIGEDLGSVPEQTREVMKELGIYSTKVVRWERVWKEDGRFIPLDHYPFHSYTTISTHDTESLAEWWVERKNEVELYLEMRHRKWRPLNKKERFELLKEAHGTTSQFHVNLLSEYLSLFDELVHPTLADERINIPGTPSEQNWRFRFLPSIETLTTHKGLATMLADLIR